MTTNMQIEDRLIQKLKSDEIGKWFEDEDLFDLAKQAIDKAFFKERTIQDGYHSKTIPSLVVKFAEENLKDIVKDVVIALVKKKVEDDPDFLAKVMGKTFEADFQETILKALKGTFFSGLYELEARISENVRRSLVR